MKKAGDKPNGSVVAKPAPATTTNTATKVAPVKVVPAKPKTGPFGQALNCPPLSVFPVAGATPSYNADHCVTGFVISLQMV